MVVDLGEDEVAGAQVDLAAVEELGGEAGEAPVSYTHLTLPTSDLV